MHTLGFSSSYSFVPLQRILVCTLRSLAPDSPLAAQICIMIIILNICQSTEIL